MHAAIDEACVHVFPVVVHIIFSFGYIPPIEDEVIIILFELFLYFCNAVELEQHRPLELCYLLRQVLWVLSVHLNEIKVTVVESSD